MRQGTVTAIGSFVLAIVFLMLYPSDARDRRFARAQELYSSHHYDAAFKTLGALEDEGSKSGPEALQMMGLWYESSGDKRKASDCYHRLVREYPATAHSIDAIDRVAAFYYEQMRDYRTAITWYHLIESASPHQRALYPEHVKGARCRLAMAYQELSDWQEAIKRWREYGRDYPEERLVGQKRVAVCYAQSGRYQEAIAVAKPVADTLRSNDPSKTEEIDSIVSSCRTALKSGKPVDFAAAAKSASGTQKAVDLNALKDVDSFLAVLNERPELARDIQMAMYNKADGHLTQQEYSEAAEWYGAVVSKYSHGSREDVITSEARRRLGVCYENVQDWTKAIATFRECAKIHPDQLVWAQKRIGGCYATQGDYNKAAASIREALAKTPIWRSPGQARELKDLAAQYEAASQSRGKPGSDSATQTGNAVKP